MTLGHVLSAQGHGWEAAVGEKTYWFGRGHSGRLLGAFSSVIDLLDAFDDDNERAAAAKSRFDLATDKKMTVDAHPDASPDDRWVVHILKIEGKVVGYCVDTPDGALRTLYDDLESASAVVPADNAPGMT